MAIKSMKTKAERACWLEGKKWQWPGHRWWSPGGDGQPILHQPGGEAVAGPLAMVREKMKDPAGTWGHNGIRGGGPDVADDDLARRRKGPKFTFASGERPLDGFTIKRGLGVGGFGEVYYATTDAGKDVALKRIQRNLDVELRGVRQCLNLKHPNLLALFDIKYDDHDQAWVVMEFVPGESLQDVIQRNPNGMPRDEVERWFNGIAAGVAHLHDCGIVHRDLKPGNVFMDGQTVKIGDYGLSKFISCSRRSGQTESVGTFHYMAPEIGRGRYGKEIDIYALGIVLYEMLTGHVPYEGESTQEIIMKHLTADPDLSLVPAECRSVIANALAKDPEKRTASVSEMVAMLPHHTSIAAADKQQVITAEVVPHPATPPRQLAGRHPKHDEPIAAAVGEFWAFLRRSWNEANFGTATKFVLLTAIVVCLMVNMNWLIPLGIVTFLAYCGYRLLRAMVRTAHKPSPPRTLRQPSVAARPVATPTPTPTTRRITKADEERYLRAQLAEKKTSEHGAELLGSFLLAAMAATLIGVVMIVFSSHGHSGRLLDWAPTYTWMTISSTLAAWGILTMTKLWSTRSGDPTLRRFAMLGLGLAIGVASYGLAEYLMVKPDYVLPDDFMIVDSSDLPTALHAPDGSPRLLGYLGYFGLLFLAFRWWRQTDPLRVTRLSVLATAVSVVGAIVIHGFVPMPRGFMLALITAVATQVAAPWMDDDRRREARTALTAEQNRS